MYDMNSEWDRYMCRYEGYTPQTLDEFVERGIATYDEATDTYTVTNDDGTTFTVTTSAEFS